MQSKVIECEPIACRPLFGCVLRGFPIEGCWNYAKFAQYVHAWALCKLNSRRLLHTSATYRPRLPTPCQARTTWMQSFTSYVRRGLVVNCHYSETHGGGARVGNRVLDQHETAYGGRGGLVQAYLQLEDDIERIQKQYCI